MLNRILVVDDDQDLTSLLSSYLVGMGFDVATARSSSEGSSILKAIKCDGILIDLDMQGAHGLTVLREIRQQYPHIPIIVFGEKEGRGDAVSALTSGATDYFQKPVDQVLVEKKCRRLFG